MEVENTETEPIKTEEPVEPVVEVKKSNIPEETLQDM